MPAEQETKHAIGARGGRQIPNQGTVHFGAVSIPFSKQPGVQRFLLSQTTYFLCHL